MATLEEQFRKADKTGKFSNFKPSGNHQGGRDNYGGFSGNRDTRDNRDNATFPSDYLSNGYSKAGSSDMDKDYILKYARTIGKMFTADNRDGKLAYGKIRIFFEEVTRVSDDLRYNCITCNEAQIRLSQLIARVYKRNTMGNVSHNFRDFITKNIEYIVELKDDDTIRENINRFKYHYEAVIGFTVTK